jgi:PAS domain S-box-containing protein
MADAVQAHLAAIVASSDDAIISKDLNGVVQSWNESAERIFGYTAAEMVGRPIAILVPADRPNEEPEILQRLRRGDRVDHFQTVRVRKDGRRIDVSVTISPVKDTTGRIVGASKVARDITQFKRVMAERQQLLESEQAARREAERVNRVKDEFLATLGHELRTPLNAILGWAQILRTGADDPKELAEGLETIERNARAQNQLIEELLDMSRIVSGKMRLDVQRVDLPQVIGDVVQATRPAANAKGIRLSQLCDPKAGPVTGDPARLQQVVWNLVANAVKFTPRGGSVQVFLQRVSSHLEITVSDTGQGIKPEFLPHLFQRFNQADGSTTRHHGGLGLGLAIARHLVELHGGTIRATSPGEGAGATFTVTLPITVVFDDRSDDDVPHPTAAQAQPSAPPYRVDLAGLKVLVVDDEPDARALVRRVLESNHARVYIAESAADGFDLLRSERPDLLLSDIGMPGEDGYSLIARVRQLAPDEGGNTPAVALTAFARSEDRRRALIAGFQMHLPKPVEPAELLAAVASIASLSRPHAKAQ